MPAAGTRFRDPVTCAVLVWLAGLAAVLAVPYLVHSPTRGEDLTRNTVRLALAYYAAAVTLLLLLHPGEWAGRSSRWRLARWCWTLGWLAFLVHLAVAFHHYDHWSHAHAVERTRKASGVGEGVYVSHLFTLAWTADVAFWWLRPDRYAARPRWVGRVLHGFMAFVIFNATVVYESGPIRWAGLLLFGWLLGVMLCRPAMRRAGASA